MADWNWLFVLYDDSVIFVIFAKRLYENIQFIFISFQLLRHFMKMEALEQSDAFVFEYKI